MRYLILVISGLLLYMSATPDSGQVSVKGVHLCCGGCQEIANAALSEVKDLADISCDLNTKVISFKAGSEEAAQAGIEALADAGFFGEASYNKEPLTYPASGAEKDSKSNTIVLTGVHLCCTACVTASHTALEDVKGVTLIDIDRNEQTIKLTGDSIGVPEAVAALNKAGFFCRLEKPEKK
jgi:copper chaperone CopZ